MTDTQNNTDEIPIYKEKPKLCKYCNKEIKFIKDVDAGKFRPVDADPIKVVTSDGKVVRAYRPHWEHCPGLQT